MDVPRRPTRLLAVRPKAPTAAVRVSRRAGWLLGVWLLTLAAGAGLVNQLARPSSTVALDTWLFAGTEVRGDGGLAWLGRGLILTGQRGLLLPLVALAIVSGWHRMTLERVVGSLLALAGSAAAVSLLKATLPRPAPHAQLGPLLAQVGSSFPSGHVAGAAAAGWALALLVPRRSTGRLRLGAVLVGASVASVGVILPGYHWLSDCTGGLLVASAVLVPLELLTALGWHRSAPSGLAAAR